MFYFTGNHGLQHVFNMLKHLQKCFANVSQLTFLQVFYAKTFAKHLQII